METAEISQRGKEAAAGGAQKARDRMSDMLTERSTKAAESSRGMAEDARSVGEELRRRGRGRAADMAESTADRVQRMGEYLDRSDGATIMDDATRYGRRHPAMVALGSFAAGLAAARFVKAADRPHGGGGDRRGLIPSESPSATHAGVHAAGAPASSSGEIRPAGSPQ
ncbi:MAG: hypothetical protein U0237_15160 [Thermoleophilia bacterium]